MGPSLGGGWRVVGVLRLRGARRHACSAVLLLLSLVAPLGRGRNVCTSRRVGYIEATDAKCRLTPRSSGRVRNKVPSSNIGVRAAQLNR